MCQLNHGQQINTAPPSSTLDPSVQALVDEIKNLIKAVNGMTAEIIDMQITSEQRIENEFNSGTTTNKKLADKLLGAKLVRRTRALLRFEVDKSRNYPGGYLKFDVTINISFGNDPLLSKSICINENKNESSIRDAFLKELDGLKIVVHKVGIITRSMIGKVAVVFK